MNNSSTCSRSLDNESYEEESETLVVHSSDRCGDGSESQEDKWDSYTPESEEEEDLEDIFFNYTSMQMNTKVETSCQLKEKTE